MPNRSKPRLFDLLLLVGFAFIFFHASDLRHRENYRTTISSDPEGYYKYLPAVFIYKDIHKLPGTFFQGQVVNEKGETYTKYTCGVAYFELPFFLAAHAYSHLAHLHTTGYDPPYAIAIMACGVFWAFVGLYLLLSLLLRYFSRTTAWVSLLCIMLGTNFYNYATFEIGMSHVYNFTLCTAALFVTDLYYESPSKGKAMLLGLVCGWIALSRPTNMMVFVFLLLFKITDWNNFKLRLQFFKERFTDIFAMIPFFILILVPQMLYWHEMSGHWIKDSYSDEHFIYWNHPKIAAVLFDTQNGLFLYSPVLLLFLWAVFFRRKDPRTNFAGTIIVFCVITYIFASWWAWWFGAAFGHRCYIDYMPLLAFPLAVTVEHLLTQKNAFRIPVLAILALLCYYNIKLSGMYMDHGAIWDGPDWRWAWGRWLGLVKHIF